MLQIAPLFKYDQAHFANITLYFEVLHPEIPRTTLARKNLGIPDRTENWAEDRGQKDTTGQDRTDDMR